MVDRNWPIETVQQSMSEMLSFVSVKNDLCALGVVEGRRGGDQAFFDVDSEHFFGLFVPQKQASLFNSFVTLSEIVLECFFSFTLVEVTLDCFLLNLGSVDPFRVVLVMLRSAKHVIVEQFLMLFLGEY